MENQSDKTLSWAFGNVFKVYILNIIGTDSFFFFFLLLVLSSPQWVS